MLITYALKSHLNVDADVSGWSKNLKIGLSLHQYPYFLHACRECIPARQWETYRNRMCWPFFYEFDELSTDLVQFRLDRYE